MTDWLSIRTEYINGSISYRDLCQKYNVSFATLRARAKKEQWPKLREEQQHRISAEIAQKTTDVIVKGVVDRTKRLLVLSDKLAEQLECAIDELDRQMVKNKKKVRVIEYKDKRAIGRPTKEVTEEDELLEVVHAPIDRLGLQQLSAALKNIKDVQTLDAVTGGATEGIYRIDSMLIADSFHPVRRDILQGKHTEYVFSGGRGSAKSSFISLEVIELLINHPDMHALICRQVADTLRDSVYAQIKWAVDQLNLIDKFIFKVSPLEITYKPTGQKIYFRGADDPLKIKSIKPGFGYIGILWFEELDQFHGGKAIRSIEQSAIRGGDKAYILKSFNPPQTATSWANTYVKTPKENRIDHHSTYLDVPPEWLGKTFIEEAKFLKEVNPRAYEHEYMGVANGTGGSVFENVIIRAINEDELRRFDYIYNGVDWGWFPDPFRFHRVHYQANERRLYIFDEITGHKLSNEKIVELFKSHGVNQSDLITADSGGEGPKSIGDFRVRGYSMRGAVKGPGSVESSMKWLCSLREIIIDPVRCPNAAEEFLNYEYERTKDGEIVSGYPDKNNHSIDAVRYALECVWSKRGK